MQKQSEMLTARVSKQMRRALRKQVRAEKRGESAIVRTALENYFAQTQSGTTGGAAAPETKTPVQNEIAQAA